jgi:deoxyadenosine/deoxycytidine kinase
MNQRGRECESSVSLEYLQKLDKAHVYMIDHLKQYKPHIKIIEIDGVACADDVYHNVLNILEKELSII